MKLDEMRWLIQGFAVLSLAVIDTGHVFAGSVTGSQAYSTSGSSCDNRINLSGSDLTFCSAQMKKFIRESCYVAVNTIPTKGRECGWQGCGYLYLVGKPPKLSGESFDEYGVLTPHNGAYRDMGGGLLLPKRPFARHYLKAGEALDAKRACPANPQGLPADVLGAICAAEGDVLQLNPYWLCMSQ